MQRDLFEAYFDQHRIYSFEGPSGVRNLNRLTQDVCGYTDLEDFLEDNPGAIEAVIEWIQSQNNRDWEANVKSLITEEDDEE